MFQVLRSTTLHPALVHLPLGLLPFAALALIIAAKLRSERWAFVADVTLFAGAASAALAGALGLAAYFVLEWPGGLEPWPLVHLLLGVTTVAFALVLATARALRRRTNTGISAGWAASGVLLALLALATGYVGGEVLVFHGGAAVKAAGKGALAPPLGWTHRRPKNVLDSMGPLRAAWSGASIALAESVVEEPSPARFESVAREARHMQEIARWLIERSPAQLPEPHEHSGEESPARGGGPGEDEQGPAHSREQSGGHLREMSLPMLQASIRLEQAALRQDLEGALRALGDAHDQCARCHQHLRWNGH